MKIFISYSRVDRAFTEKFVDRLRRMYPGDEVWFDDELYGGDNWWEAILNAIGECDIFIYLLSNESVTSPYCQAEFDEAQRLQKRFVTVQVRDRTKLTAELGDIQFVNMKDGPDDPDALTNLGRAINYQRGKLPKRPPKPLSPERTTRPDLVEGTPRTTEEPIDTPALRITRAAVPAPRPNNTLNPTVMIAIIAAAAIVIVTAIITIVPALSGARATPTVATPPISTTAPTATTAQATEGAEVFPTITPAGIATLSSTVTTPAISSLLISKAEVISDKLRVHTLPSNASLVVGELTSGTVIMVAGDHEPWATVYSSNLKIYGYVQSVSLNFATTKPDPDAFLIENPALMNATLVPPKPLPEASTPQEKALVRLYNNYGGLAETIAQQTGIPLATVMAVWAAESGGTLYAASGRMPIRFEVHVFYANWGKANEEEFSNYFQFDRSTPHNAWKGHMWRSAPAAEFQSFHGSQDKEWQVFTFARTLSPTNALSSISMGASQFMGFNYYRLGYASPQQMFDFFSASPAAQVLAFLDFARGESGNGAALQALIDGDILTFATAYNGTGNAETYRDIIRNYINVFNRLKS